MLVTNMHGSGLTHLWFFSRVSLRGQGPYRTPLLLPNVGEHICILDVRAFLSIYTFLYIYTDAYTYTYTYTYKYTYTYPYAFAYAYMYKSNLYIWNFK